MEVIFYSTKIMKVFLNFCQNYGIVPRFAWIMESTLMFPKVMGL
jgi:hypothetical protein